MPEKCSQSLPCRTVCQSISPGFSVVIALVGAVVDDLRSALRGAGLQVEEPQPVAAPDDVVGVQPVTLQVIDARLADVVGRHLGDRVAFQAEVDQGDKRIGLGARVVRFEISGLAETLKPVRAQSQQ